MQSTGAPVGWYGVPAAPAAVGSGVGYRAVAVSRWRRLIVSLGAFSLMAAILFEIWATVTAFGIRSVSTDATSLFMWSWLYKPMEFTFESSSMRMYVGYAPVLLGVALVAALVFISWVTVRPVAALKKAGARGALLWSSREQKDRWAGAVGMLTSSKVSLFRSHYRVLLALGAIASLVAVGLSALAFLNRESVTADGQHLSNLSVGLGPWVCAVAGTIAAVAFVLAMLGHDRNVVVHADGSVLDRTS